MIYLDSAATSLIKPICVERAVVSAMRTMASPGRGCHLPAQLAAEEVYAAREAAAELFNAEDCTNVVFTANATHALNLAIGSLAGRGTRVVISGFEHNSVTRPLTALGADIRIAGTRLFDPADTLADFEEQIKSAQLVVCTHVSNVFGYVLPVYEIGELCRRRAVPYIVDASQSAGVLDVDFRRLGANFVAMPGHKSLFGPQGTGILLCRGDARPLLHGGSGSDSIEQHMPGYMPDRLEAGTHNVCGIAGLHAGMEYIKERGIENIRLYERRLLRRMCDELNGTSGLETFAGDAQSGVLSVRAVGMDCEELGSRLAARGVCVRAGLHCAPRAHMSAGTLETGTVRFSFSPFVTERQTVEAAGILKDILKSKNN